MVTLFIGLWQRFVLASTQSAGICSHGLPAVQALLLFCHTGRLLPVKMADGSFLCWSHPPLSLQCQRQVPSLDHRPCTHWSWLGIFVFLLQGVPATGWLCHLYQWSAATVVFCRCLLTPRLIFTAFGSSWPVFWQPFLISCGLDYKCVLVLLKIESAFQFLFLLYFGWFWIWRGVTILLS